jgi:ribonuclease G
MAKELVISSTPHETRVAILEEGQLCEIYVEREKEYALVGSIYKGRVTRVLPGMQSAFVDMGLDTDAFLYVSDVLEDIEDYDHIVNTVEGKVQKMEQQGGGVFAAPAGEAATAPTAEGTAPTGETQPRENVAPPVSPSRPAPNYPPSHQRRPEGRGFGRQDRDRRGGRDRYGHRHGRELPPSKYASPRPYGPPSEEHEPVILPGESLAKYRNRIPQPAATVAGEPAHSTAPAGPESAAPSEPQPESQTALHAPPPAVQEEPARAAEPATGVSEIPVPGPTSEPGFAPEASQSSQAAPITPQPVNSEPELSGEEATVLAEQIAEAQKEEFEAASAAEREAGEEAAAEAEEGFVEEEEEDVAQPEGTEPAVPGAAASEGPAEELAAAPREIPAPPKPQPATARIDDSVRARLQRPMRRGGRRRGGHRPRPHDRHMAQRRPQLISELLKPGQEIIIQITKEPLGRKGARITSHIALPGRFLVYMPTLDHMGVSRKISSAEERARLRRLVSELKGANPGGFIVRTAAESASDADIRADVEFLTRTWADIRKQAEERKAPALLHRDLNLVERILRDYLSSDYTSIWVDNEEEYAKVVEFVSRFQPQLVNRVKLYTKETPLFEELGIQPEIDKSLRPKVWLKSGGYIVINHTEALVAIDVNTGKYVGKGSTRLEDTIVRTNLEAVKEIVRQIRLRDLGGIIVIDFIDMEERRNREKVLQALEEALKADRAPSKTLSFNEFGLVAITRKRTKQALERVLCQPCPYCTGSGMVKSIPTICYEIQVEARKMSGEVDSASLTLRVHPEIAKALKTRESALIEELERAAHKNIIIQADPTLHWEQYDIY